MAASNVVYAWEELPEYRTTQQFGRCVGRVIASLPRRFRWTAGRTLIRCPVLIARGIAGANAEMPRGGDLSTADREMFRRSALDGIEICRDALSMLKSEQLGNLPDVLVGLVLLDRIEAWVSHRILPGQGSPDPSERAH